MGDDPRREGARVAIVFAGGDPPVVDALPALADLPAPLVIAADSGLHHASTLGWHVDIVVGDLDSVDPSVLDAARRAGAAVERHPTDKDATDLELALATARAHGCDRIVVVGGAGGRLDHFLANAFLLAAPEWAPARIEAFMGTSAVYVVRGALEVDGHPGDLVSLLAVGGPAHGVETDGLRFPLHQESLTPGSTRGVSNELVGSHARVTVADGVLLVIVVHHLSRKALS